MSTLSSCSLLSEKYGWKLTKASHSPSWWNSRGWWNHCLPRAWIMLPDVDDVPFLVQLVMTSSEDKITGKEDSWQTKVQKAQTVAGGNLNLTPLLWNLYCIFFRGTLSHSRRDYLAKSQNFLNVLGLFKYVNKLKWEETQVNLSRQPPAPQTSCQPSALVSLCT